MEWISVKERLPEVPGWYLVVVDSEIVSKRRSPIEIGECFSSFQRIGDNLEPCLKFFEYVTHWMPLPAPPQSSPSELKEDSHETLDEPVQRQYCNYCKCETLQVFETMGMRCQKCLNSNPFGNCSVGEFEKYMVDMIRTHGFQDLSDVERYFEKQKRKIAEAVKAHTPSELKEDKGEQQSGTSLYSTENIDTLKERLEITEKQLEATEEVLVEVQQELRAAEKRGQSIGKSGKVERVCYCGSLRVAMDAFKKVEYEAVMKGEIALLPCCMYVDTEREFGAKSGYKQKADELHKRKIDIADRVVILNVGGYIGESTRSEINYALSIGKPVEYLEPPQHKIYSCPYCLHRDEYHPNEVQPCTNCKEVFLTTDDLEWFAHTPESAKEGPEKENEVKNILFLLLKNGGKIVRSSDLSITQIAHARAERRFFIDVNNCGYVWIPSKEESPETPQPAEATPAEPKHGFAAWLEGDDKLKSNLNASQPAEATPAPERGKEWEAPFRERIEELMKMYVPDGEPIGSYKAAKYVEENIIQPLQSRLNAAEQRAEKAEKERDELKRKHSNQRSWIIKYQAQRDEQADKLQQLTEEVKRLKEVLEEAGLQIEYLHGKFKETGTGNSVLARIKTLMELP